MSPSCFRSAHDPSSWPAFVPYRSISCTVTLALASQSITSSRGRTWRSRADRIFWTHRDCHTCQAGLRKTSRFSAKPLRSSRRSPRQSQVLAKETHLWQ